MDIYEAINSRRSIRKFTDRPVSREHISQILEAAILSPSAKNAQPWRFVVIEGEKAKRGMMTALNAGIDIAASDGSLPEQMVSAVKYSFQIMEKAPVTIFVLNPLGVRVDKAGTEEHNGLQIANIQSVGAAIQNILLAATGLGIGSLWICDIFAAYGKVCDWLETDDQLIAAVTLGYADESPPSRPRRAFDEVVKWL